LSVRGWFAGTIAALVVASLAAATAPAERRFRFLLRPIAKAPQPRFPLEETAVVRPNDIAVVLERAGLWWIRYSAQSDRQRCELQEHVELHDLSRKMVETMTLDGPLPDCVPADGAPPPAAKSSAPMAPAIAEIVTGALKDAAAVQPFAHIAYTRLAPLVPGKTAGPPRLAFYRVNPLAIDCDADARHGAPCPADPR
jgi:hypothetical protein